MSDAAPLILTLTLDDASQAYFDELRQRHFPPERNYLAAHLTLFHHLPGAHVQDIVGRLRQLCAQQPPLPLQVSGLRFMGMGVAFRLENVALRELHHRLQTEWQDWLTSQDQQKLQPHVTVQNKVTPTQARHLFVDLLRTFEPFMATATGLHLWAYRGGPWESLQQLPFKQAAETAAAKSPAV
jgi:2'-5' RNA ligase